MGRGIDFKTILQLLLANLVTALILVASLSGLWNTSGTALIITSSNGSLSIATGFGYVYFNNPAYEIMGLLNTTQGFYGSTAWDLAIFNPGADVDATVTTDFEDLAAPAADVAEFADQDRALLTDSMASTVFWNGVLGALTGIAIHAILSTDLWRFI
jgi:hypothetical protein